MYSEDNRLKRQCLKSNNCFDDTLMNFVCDGCSPRERANVVHHSCVCRGLYPLTLIVLRASSLRHIVPPSHIKALKIISIEDG